MNKAGKKDDLKTLLGDVGHEYNNLLTTILANLRLAGQENLPYSTKKYLEKAADTTVRAADLTHYLLTLSQNQNPKLRIIEPNELTRNLRLRLKKHLGKFRTLRFQPSLIRYKVYVDPVEFEKALMALCIHSCEAMSEGGEITVKVSGHTVDGSNPVEEQYENGHYVLIEVSDDGSGLSAAEMTKALSPLKGSNSGSGVSELGLGQVIDFVERAQGYLRIESRPPKGTSVKIYLPRYTDISEDQEPQVTGKAVSGLKGNGEIILLVEDDLNVLTVVGQGLKARNYDVLLAEDGEKAKSIIRAEKKIDLLITDVFLVDEISGKEVAESFHRNFPKSGVIFCSGYHENVVRDKLKLKKDQGEMVAKPYELTTLLRKMGMILAKQAKKS